MPPPVTLPGCVELPPEEPPRFVDAEFVVRVGTADILFLIDATGTMSDEISQLSESLRDVLFPQIVETIPNVHFSVAEFGDFPVVPYGEPIDIPFRLRQRSVSDVDAAAEAVDGIRGFWGRDVPESHVEALYQTATGDGSGAWIPPTRCAEGTVGYPCFREDGSRIILLFTDAPMHNGPGDSAPYDTSLIAPAPATYDMAISAIRDIGAKVVGLYSGGEFIHRGLDDLNRVARDSGAVTTAGDPIVFDIGSNGERLDSGVVRALERLVGDVPIDVDLVVEDDDDDGVDALELVSFVETTGAIPAEDAQDLGDGYGSVRPGARVGFRVWLTNDEIERGPEPVSYSLTMVLRGDGVTRLVTRTVEVVIPSWADEGCERL
jgi:hypothetical protein